jgi:phosphatidate phosphatase APP1
MQTQANPGPARHQTKASAHAAGAGRGIVAALTLIIATCLSAVAAPLVSELKSDEEIVFYPTLIWPATNGSNWMMRVHGCVFEQERARITLMFLRSALGLKGVEMSKAEAATFKERARHFFVDNERGHRVVIDAGGETFDLGESGANGHFEKVIQLDALPGSIANTPPPSSVSFTAVLKQRDARRFTGTAVVMAGGGISVVSDVDDTIKISEVLDRNAMMQRTFLHPFEAVPGMAEVYRSWATNGATFHYVSASPWQLHLPLRDFARTNGFPDGSWSMKTWRVKDRSFASLFGNPQAYKVATIGALMRQFPGRAFVLVGDSGERDPEAYAELARQFPTQVKAILIRDVTDELPTAERYRTHFAGLPAERWRVFKEPAELGRLRTSQRGGDAP